MDFIAIAAGWENSLGLKSDGTVVAWGGNRFGTLNVPAPHSNFIMIAAGHSHGLILEGINFEGFLSPICNGSINEATAGQTIPVKWRITDLDGIPISNPASFLSLKSYQVNCESFLDVPTSIVDELAAGSSDLQYLGDGWWQYNWKTKKVYSGQCRTMKLSLYDSSQHKASFRFK
jgi:hypothetical protein